MPAKQAARSRKSAPKDGLRARATSGSLVRPSKHRATLFEPRAVAQLAEHRSPKPGVESSSLSGPVSHGRKESRYPCGIPTSPVPQLDCRSQPPETARIGVRLRAPGGSTARGTRRAVRAVSACWPLGRLFCSRVRLPRVRHLRRSDRWAGLERDSLRGETGEHRAPPFPVLPSLS